MCRRCGVVLEPDEVYGTKVSEVVGYSSYAHTLMAQWSCKSMTKKLIRNVNVLHEEVVRAYFAIGYRYVFKT